jgi:hypothetical protein
MTIVEFLLARIEADEKNASPTVAEMNAGNIASGISGFAAAYLPPQDLPKGAWDRFRVLAECAAKRAILSTFIETEKTRAAFDDMHGDPDMNEVMGPLRDVLRSMAAAYEGHEDFDPAWLS